MMGALIAGAAAVQQSIAGMFGGASLGLGLKAAAVVVALGLIATIWLWVAHLREENAELRAERGRLHHQIAVQRRLIEDRDRAVAALAAAERQAELKRRAAERAREEVRHAPHAEDGAVAPVLRRALERLR